jgi:hypothetical protein
MIASSIIIERLSFTVQSGLRSIIIIFLLSTYLMTILSAVNEASILTIETSRFFTDPAGFIHLGLRSCERKLILN